MNPFFKFVRNRAPLQAAAAAIESVECTVNHQEYVAWMCRRVISDVRNWRLRRMAADCVRAGKITLKSSTFLDALKIDVYI